MISDRTMTSGRWLVIAVVVVGFFTGSARSAERTVGVEVKPAAILSQARLDGNACGPVAIVNMLQVGDPTCREALAALDGDSLLAKAQTIINQVGSNPSTDYGDGARIRSSGVSCVDLTAIVSDVVAGEGLTARGEFLDRRGRETDRAFLERVHGLLADALREERAPIISIRSFAVQKDSSFDDGFSWTGLIGHYVVLTRVPAQLAEHDWGFAFEFIDPISGRLEQGFVRLERQRAFAAAKGNASQYQWLNGKPFLLVTAPSLSLGTADRPWWSRTIMTLNYAITLGKN